MKCFLSGAVTLGYLVLSLFFLRFWKKVHERLFLWFAMAFLALGIERTLFIYMDLPNESTHYLYSIRLMAFILFLAAIIDKNRLKKTSA